MAQIGGYFAWVKLNGKGMPIKYDKDRVGIPAGQDRKFKEWNAVLIGKEIPLTYNQYRDLSLNQLAFLYPCPQLPSDPKVKL